jgi:uncharacterized protein (AIM24 family)
VFNRFTGPGRIGLQSMYYHPPVGEGSSNTTSPGGMLGGLVRGVMDN